MKERKTVFRNVYVKRWLRKTTCDSSSEKKRLTYRISSRPLVRRLIAPPTETSEENNIT